MSEMFKPPKEGALYKSITIDAYHFELRFGYYADFERQNGEPVVIYPDLTRQALYTQEGLRLVTAIQDPCPHYRASNPEFPEDCCCDCIYYRNPGDEIGVCSLPSNQNQTNIPLID